MDTMGSNICLFSSFSHGETPGLQDAFFYWEGRFLGGGAVRFMKAGPVYEFPGWYPFWVKDNDS